MLTDEQRAVISVSRTLEKREILKVEACAGSGKTSTLTEVAKANPDSRFLYLAFNRSIVEEARTRFPENVRIFTTHGLAWRWYAHTYGSERLKDVRSGYRPFDLEGVFPGAGSRELASLISRFTWFCHSARAEPEDADVKHLFEAVRKGRVPMTHDFYLKLYQLECQPKFRNYEYVLLDEAQDTNAVTMSLFCDNDCRRILVGDSHQAIYAFRGAVNALGKTAAYTTLHLSYSFRSVQKILDRANYFLGSFAPDRRSFVPMKSAVRAGRNEAGEKTAYIFRTNAAVIEAVSEIGKGEEHKFRLLRPAEAVFGCALGLLELDRHRPEKISPSFAWLRRFRNLDAVQDFAEDTGDRELLLNLKTVDSYGSELYDIFRTAKSLGSGEGGSRFITTAHTSKGLEWDRVRIGRDFPDLDYEYGRIGKKKGMTADEFSQELNLYYVAVTRAKSVLQDESPNDEAYRDAML